MSTSLRRGAILVGVVVLFLLPWILPQYRLGQMTLALLWALTISGLVMLTGRIGLLSIGHSAFFGIGAYTTAILLSRDILPFAPALVISGLVAAAAAAIFALPAMRLHGFNIVIVTASLAIFFPLGVQRWDELTGGTQGMAVPQLGVPAGLPVSTTSWTYFVCLAVTILGFLFLRFVIRGRLARAMDTIRLSADTAAAGGVNVVRYKQSAFILSACYAGVAGSLYAVALGYVAPASFGLMLSLTFVAGLIVGGSGLLTGAVIGAVFIQFTPLATAAINPAYTELLYAAVLIGIVMMAPRGIAGVIHRYFSTRTRSARSQSNPQHGR